MKNILSYRAVILDVDGTLYYQGKLRIIMVGLLLGHVLRHPSRLKDIKILKTFRHLREHADFPEGDLSALQYQVVADRLSIDVEQVRTVVERWIYREPLPYLYSCRDERLISIARSLRSRGVILIAYSDYPAVDKLQALGLEVDFVFHATDSIINCLKPDPKGLRNILNQLAISSQESLFIGDRDEKDGLCARQVGMDFQILPKSKSSRNHLYAGPDFLIGG